MNVPDGLRCRGALGSGGPASEPGVRFTVMDLALIKLNLSMGKKPQSLETSRAPDKSLLMSHNQHAAAVPQALENSLNKRRLT